jgi:hypothetical protein
MSATSENPSAAKVAESTSEQSVSLKTQKLSIKCSYCGNIFWLNKADALRKFTCAFCDGVLMLTEETKKRIIQELNLKNE